MYHLHKIILSKGYVFLSENICSLFDFTIIPQANVKLFIHLDELELDEQLKILNNIFDVSLQTIFCLKHTKHQYFTYKNLICITFRNFTL